jgi:hypothetical protein
LHGTNSQRKKGSELKKMVFIAADLVEDPQAYEGKTNTDLEKEILSALPTIPYVARIEKVKVLDVDQRKGFE